MRLSRLGLLILGLLALLKISKKREKQNHSTTNRQNTTDDIQDPTPTIKVSIVQPSTEDEQKWRDEQKDFWNRQLTGGRRLNGITLGAAIVGLLGLGAIYRQADIADKTAQTALDQLHTSHRPWVGIVNPIEIKNTLTFSKDGGAIVLQGTMKNFGNSPGIAALAVGDVVFDENFIIAQKEQQRLCSSDDLAKPKVGSTIFPTQEIPTILMHLGAPWSKIKRNKNGATTLWWVGCIVYWDSFGKVHKTGLFYRFYPSEIRPEGSVEGRFETFFIGNFAT